MRRGQLGRMIWAITPRVAAAATVAQASANEE
jgi:hypothetical protein